jgi:hypothetical protein
MKFKLAIAILALGLIGGPASASTITYVWQGDNGATGFFSLDSTAFSNTIPDFVVQTALSAFSFDVGGFTFALGDVIPSSDIVFNSTVNPPAYLDGAGAAATNIAGDSLSFFPGSIVVTVPTGAILATSTGKFVVGTVAAPEPGTVMLLVVGLAAVGSIRRRMKTP